MRTLYLDCFSGISGDMTVGALIDLGVKPSTIEWELSKLDLGDFHMHVDREARQNLVGVRFSVHEGATHSHACEHDHKHEHEHAHSHGGHHHHEHGEHEHHHHHEHGDECEHDHDHGGEVTDAHAEHGKEAADEFSDHDHGNEMHAHHEHDHAHGHGRTHREIRELISGSDLSAFVRKHALSMFQRIAEAEGKIHGVNPAEVQFHEVGALDSIVDIIAVCVGLEELGIERVLVSELQDGKGWIECAHGRFPIPSMATLEILRGVPIGQIDEPFEFITPTGAAIVAEFGSHFAPLPRIKVDRIGYGAGSRHVPGRPNVLRAVLGETAGEPSPENTDTVIQIECNIDDMNPEIVGAVVEKLLEAGALDAFLTPVYMKKNRPGTLLTVLTDASHRSQIASLIFAETTTFGIRYSEFRREKLTRRVETVATPFGKVEVKIGTLGEDVVQASPEFESVKKVAAKSKQSLKAVYDAAVAAYREINQTA